MINEGELRVQLERFRGPKGERGDGVIPVDATLTQAGEAADARVTGEEIAWLREALEQRMGRQTAFSAAERLDGWLFSKDGVHEEPVRLPHTCNAQDCTTAAMYRGKTMYRCTQRIDVVEGRKYYLLFQAVGQMCTLYVNNARVTAHYGGYTPFIADISGFVTAGDNEIRVTADNAKNLESIPVAGDFALGNGIYRGAYLLTCAGVGYDPEAYGSDKMHVTQADVTRERALFRVQSRVMNLFKAGETVTLRTVMRGEQGCLIDERMTVDIPAGKEFDFDRTYSIQAPRLWQGLNDPHLYEISQSLIREGTEIERLSVAQGLRALAVDADEGFMLNGKPYPLRGVALHEDAPDRFMALTDADVEQLGHTIGELGATFVRLAHYPHDRRVFAMLDRMGVIVQTEIPWVDECGVNATETYFERIKKNCGEMIREYYNHTCIAFWGLSNELGNTHEDNPQGRFDAAKAKAWHNTLYAYAKEWDNSRLIGYVTDSTGQTGWDADWCGMNIYKGWYGGTFDEFGGVIDSVRSAGTMALSEYGAGANPAHHSETPLTTTVTGNGGARHDEEYQCLLHEAYLDQIVARPWLLFTAAWTLYDFASPARMEGGLKGVNDKGLITRDRKTKKDAFYLYKAYLGGETVVHICGKRFASRDTARMTIKAYANTASVQLYVNGEWAQTLAAPDGENETGVVWTFEPLTDTGRLEIEVRGYDAQGALLGCDTAAFYNAYVPVPETSYSWDLTGNVGYVPLESYGSAYTLYAEFEDSVGEIVCGDENQKAHFVVTTKSADDTTGYGVASFGFMNDGGTKKFVGYSHALGSSALARTNVARTALMMQNEVGTYFNIQQSTLAENVGKTILINNLGLYKAESGAQYMPQASFTGVVCAHHGYMYINSTTDVYAGIDEPLENFATAQALNAALEAGTIHAATSGARLKALIFYADTCYTNKADVLFNRLNAQIDIRFDENGRPYNAGTSGALICSERTA